MLPNLHITAWTHHICMLLHSDAGLVLRGLLVNISLAVVLLFVELVTDGITGSLESGACVCVAILCDLLVGFLGGGGTGTLDGFANVVGGVPGEDVRGCVVMQMGWWCKTHLMVSIVVIELSERLGSVK